MRDTDPDLRNNVNNYVPRQRSSWLPGFRAQGAPAPNAQSSVRQPRSTSRGPTSNSVRLSLMTHRPDRTADWNSRGLTPQQAASSPLAPRRSASASSQTSQKTAGTEQLAQLLNDAEYIRLDSPYRYKKAVELCKAENRYKVRGTRPPESLDSIIGEIKRRLGGTPRHVAANTVQGTINAWSLKQLEDGIALWSLLVETARSSEQRLHAEAAAQQSPSRRSSPGQPSRARNTRTW